MAAETVTISLTHSAWVDIGGAASEVNIQATGAPIYVHLGSVAPAADSTNAMQISSLTDGMRLVLTGGTKAFARSIQQPGATIVVFRQ